LAGAALIEGMILNFLAPTKTVGRTFYRSDRGDWSQRQDFPFGKAFLAQTWQDKQQPSR